MDYDEQIKGIIEELLDNVMDRSIDIKGVQKKLLEINKKIDEVQEESRRAENDFLRELQEMINPLAYSEHPEVKRIADRIKRLVYEHKLSNARIKYLEENLG